MVFGNELKKQVQFTYLWS